MASFISLTNQHRPTSTVEYRRKKERKKPTISVKLGEKPKKSIASDEESVQVKEKIKERATLK